MSRSLLHQPILINNIYENVDYFVLVVFSCIVVYCSLRVIVMECERTQDSDGTGKEAKTSMVTQLQIIRFPTWTGGTVFCNRDGHIIILPFLHRVCVRVFPGRYRLGAE